MMNLYRTISSTLILLANDINSFRYNDGRLIILDDDINLSSISGFDIPKELMNASFNVSYSFDCRIVVISQLYLLGVLTTRGKIFDLTVRCE